VVCGNTKVNGRIIRGKGTIRRRFLRGRREKNNNWKEKNQKKKNSGVEVKEQFETGRKRNIMRIIRRTRRNVIRKREARIQ